LIPRRLLVLGRLAGEVEPDGGDEQVENRSKVGWDQKGQQRDEAVGVVHW